MAFGFKHGSKNIIRFVAKPTVTGAYTFDNAKKSAVISGYDSKAMTISGTREATSSGTYTVTFTLNKGYAWDDRTKDVLNRTWSIAKRTITVPTMTNTSYTWAVSRTFAPTISGVDSSYVSQSGTTSSSNAGSWTVTWALRFPNDTVWTGNTTANKTATWSVAKLKLTIPSISSATSFAFVEGTTRSVTVANFNNTYESQSGTTSTAAMGSYTITWALRYTTNTTWSDNSTSNKTATWSIAWVNGTSHYSNDLYNKGWYKANSLQFTIYTGSGSPVVNWNSDNLEIQYCRMKTTDTHTGKTFHMLVRENVYQGTYSEGTLTLMDYKESEWGYSNQVRFTVGSSYVEVSTTHGTGYTNPKFGTINTSNPSGSGMAKWYRWQIQRIWLT